MKPPQSAAVSASGNWEFTRASDYLFTLHSRGEGRGREKHQR